jgi:hypothetical protein
MLSLSVRSTVSSTFKFVHPRCVHTCIFTKQKQPKNTANYGLCWPRLYIQCWTTCFGPYLGHLQVLFQYTRWYNVLRCTYVAYYM